MRIRSLMVSGGGGGDCSTIKADSKSSDCIFANNLDTIDVMSCLSGAACVFLQASDTEHRFIELTTPGNKLNRDQQRGKLDGTLFAWIGKPAKKQVGYNTINA